MDLLLCHISKEEQMNFDISQIQNALKLVKEQSHIGVFFSGHDHDHREIYEIPLIRSYALKVMEQVPYLLLFLPRYPQDLLGVFLACVGQPTLQAHPMREANIPYNPEEILTMHLEGRAPLVQLKVTLTKKQFQAYSDKIVFWGKRKNIPTQTLIKRLREMVTS